MKKVIIPVMGLIMSFSAMASLKIDDLKNRPLDVSSIYVNNLDYTGRTNQNTLQIVHFEYLEKKSFKNNRSLEEKLDPADKYVYVKKIKIPVTMEIEVKGFDFSFQLGGAGDDSLETGKLKNLEGKTIGDLFLPYEGRAFNAGILVLGGGYNKATNSKGIKFSELNASYLIGPSGAIGINGGLKSQKYTLKMKPVLKAALVEIKLETYRGKDLYQVEKREEVISMDDLSKLKLN